MTVRVAEYREVVEREDMAGSADRRHGETGGVEQIQPFELGSESRCCDDLGRKCAEFSFELVPP
jgi:hypothetical protein